MNKLKLLLQRGLNSFGYQIVRCQSGRLPSEKDSSFTSFLKTARKAGFNPRLVYDVGANRGCWAQEVRNVFPDARLILFEPQKHLEDHLVSLALRLKNTDVRPFALSASSGLAMFSASDWDVTSRLVPNGMCSEDVGGSRYEVVVTTIDAEVAKDRQPVDLLKLDVEGEELNVIRGAGNTLDEVIVVVIEVGLCCQSIPNTAFSIMQIMHERGFDLMGIVNLNPYQTSSGAFATGLTWLADFVFVNRQSLLCENLSRRPGDYLDSKF
jgi:FkbM family methyltransferase